MLIPQDAEIHDNSGSPFDISISTEVSPKQLEKIINDINNFNETYDLQNYNCSDFGIQISEGAGLNLPATLGEYSNLLFSFEGRNPADLGEDIRKINSTEEIEIDKEGGTAPKRKGDC